MKSIIEIVLYEEHEKVNFYTLCFQGEESEVEKFFDAFPEGCEYDNDIDIIIKWLDETGERGADIRRLRTEGKFKDNVWAVPIDKSNLRLYIIRLSDNIVILGNGGAKNTSTYNEDEHLNKCVELLQEVDGYLKTRIAKGQIQLYRKQIYGKNLTFHLNGNYEEK